jgi:hypothetical protein
MKRLLVSSIMVLSFSSIVHSESACALDEQYATGKPLEANHPQSSYITMNIGVELGGLEKAAGEAAQGITLIGESLNKLASHPELTPEQRERMNQVLSRVDQLSQSLYLTVKQLPDTVEESIIPVVEAGNTLSNEIKWVVVITSIAIILIILAALAVLYYFVLAPGTKSVIRTASLLDELADKLKKTAEIVETSSSQNLLVIEELKFMIDKQPVTPDQKKS